jgi:hypothetical protein
MESTQSGPKPRRNLQGYLDETGLLHSPTDRVFGLGLVVSPNVNKLHRQLIWLRDKMNFHNEFKFRDVTSHNILYYKDFISEFFKCPHTTFLGIIYDKNDVQIKDARKAYNAFCGSIIADFINTLSAKDTTDYITLLADDVSSPKDDHFEKEITRKIKLKTRRQAVNSIIRLESHAVTEIQLCDVLIGTVAYAYKVQFGIITRPNKQKIELVKHVQNCIGIPALSTSFDRKVKNDIRFTVKEVHK